jgi:hypothetical protein
MSSPSHTDLREELTALADTQTFSPDPSAWDRGRRARRSSRIARGAAALAVVALVVGIGTVALRPDRDAPQAAEVPRGALPSRIPPIEPEFLEDLAIGRASVAYVDEDAVPVLVNATTGTAHRALLPDFPTQQAFRIAGKIASRSWLALSPDGTRLAYPTGSVMELEPGQNSFTLAWYRVVDLTSGASDLVEPPPGTGAPLAMSWTADGRLAVDVYGRPTSKPTRANPPPTVSWIVDPRTGDASTSPFTGIVAPGGGISAVMSEGSETVDAVQFENASGTDPVTELPPDRYPEGAVVQPIGWVEPDVLVASIDPPPSKVTEHPRLALVASPERPGSDVDFREFLPRLPPALSMSIAVDLVPDLSGDPDQELTHDFSADPPADASSDRLPIVLGGVLVLLAGLAFVRMMRKQA